ncbi:MAG: hypothetical protein MJ175_00370 [Clostridia bacterium]|nr:hypothetical protein [Clostridia bacterium]
MTPILFCMLPWMQYYDGTEHPDLPEGMNFLPIAMEGEDGECELLFGTVHGKSRIPIEKLNTEITGGFAAGVTVVFCAKAENGAVVTVGWYRGANVTAEPEILPCENENGEAYDHPFFFCARAENAVLLPEDTRFEEKWSIPRNKSGNRGAHAAGKYGFPNDSLWFADEAAAALWKKNFLLQCESYDGTNWLQDEEENAND